MKPCASAGYRALPAVFQPPQAQQRLVKVNKEKVPRLITEKQMMPAGFASIEIAQQNGSWALLDEVEAWRLPATHTYFLRLSRTAKRNLLLRLVLVKQPATRQRHITAIL